MREYILDYNEYFQYYIFADKDNKSNPAARKEWDKIGQTRKTLASLIICSLDSKKHSVLTVREGVPDPEKANPENRDNIEFYSYLQQRLKDKKVEVHIEELESESPKTKE